MKKRIPCIAMILVLALCCIVSGAGAENANNGWISITFGNTGSDFSPQGIRLAIYLVAAGDYGDWTMLDAFSDITIFTREDGSATVDATLSQIRKRITDRKLRPTEEGVTDDNGKTEFRDLKHGIYYIEMTEGPERLKMSPMLLAVPSKSGSEQVRAVAKHEYETPTPSPTPTTKPTFTPFVPPVVTPTPQEETPTPTAPQEETPTPTAPQEETPTPTAPQEETPTPTAPQEETPTPTAPQEETPTPTSTQGETPTPTATQGVTPTPTAKPGGGGTTTPAPTTTVRITREPVPTPAPENDNTPVPRHVPTLTPHPGETTISIEDYEAALGLGNIQIHVGVCYE